MLLHLENEILLEINSFINLRISSRLKFLSAHFEKKALLHDTLNFVDTSSQIEEGRN